MAMQIHCLADSFAFRVVELGLEETVRAESSGIPGIRQDYLGDAFSIGPAWKTSCRWVIPSGWSSGFYAVRLEAGATSNSAGVDYYIPFVLKGAKSASMPSVAVMTNFFTWQAYNAWGGASFYGMSPAPIVSLLRPMPDASANKNQGHVGTPEKHIFNFLKKTGYAFHAITDYDLDNDSTALDGCKVLILSAHSEYWSKEMFDRLEAFLDGGGSLLDFSGNSIWWKITVQNGRMEVRKDGGFHIMTGEKGGQWASLGRPAAAVIGVEYDPRGYDTYAPFKVVDASHWLFAGTGLRNNDLIGKSGLNKGGASGWEMDKTNQYTPSNAVVLAKGTNPGNGGAQMVFFTAPGNGGVLSAGSITFCGSLVVDTSLQKIVKNFLVLQRKLFEFCKFKQSSFTM